MQVNLQKIKPIGVVLILGFSLLALILMFTADMGVPEKFVPEHETEYYLETPEHLNELLDELEERLFPEFEDIEYYANAETMKIVVKGEGKTIKRLEQVLLRDLDERLYKIIEQ